MSVAMPQGPEVYDFFEADEDNLEDLVDNVMADEGLEIETTEDESVYQDFAHHYGFATWESMKDFVLGQGQWEETEALTKDEEAYNRQKTEFEQMTTKCHLCQEEIREHLLEGAMRGEVDKDPYIEPLVWTDDVDSYKVGEEEKTEYHFAGSCDEHTDVWFHYFEKES